METQKVIYGLIQAGKIANDKLKLHMNNFGYDTAPITTGFWRNQTIPLQFSLVVYEFGVKYENQVYIIHLIYSLKIIYKIS